MPPTRETSLGQVRPLVLGIDAGGTMTDTILVDEQGHFAVGKAPTTTHDESEGFLESAGDATGYWALALNDALEQLSVVLYSGTGMLNSLLSRTGQRVGLLVTRGMEDAVLMGRGPISLRVNKPVCKMFGEGSQQRRRGIVRWRQVRS